MNKVHLFIVFYVFVFNFSCRSLKQDKSGSKENKSFELSEETRSRFVDIPRV